ncbi:MAG: hypothetical protein AB8E82_15680 [Aureispira sp.]
MAEQLKQFYDEADNIGGLKAKIRLAVITKTPSIKATEIEDSPEMVTLFTEAMNEIRKEFK